MYVVKMKTLCIWTVVIAAVMVCGGLLLHQPSEPASAQAKQQEGIRLPVIMYHSMLKDPARQGRYVISPSEFEADLKYLSDNGYTTVVMQDLIDYVYEGKELPEKPVMLTFDDGYYNNYVYAYPLLQKYQHKMVLAIIGKYTDLFTQTPDENANYSHVTWDNLKTMMDSGLVEIQNHTYDLHSNQKGRNGCKKKKGESPQQYAAFLKNDVGKLQAEMQSNLNYAPTTFVYPFGSVSEASFPVLKEMGFKATLSCQEGINYITRDPECIYMLKRCLRPSNKSAAEILKKE